MKNLCLKLALVALVALLSVASPQTHAQIVICCVGPEPGVLFLVTTLDDHDDGACDDDCTLREAINATNARVGADGIRFGVSGVINLLGCNNALPDISDALTINGPGADQLTVRGDDSFGCGGTIFSVLAPSTATVTLANMTISHGKANEGGGIFNSQATLNIINCTLSDNRARPSGAGVSNHGTLNVTNSTFSSNGGELGALGADGGGIANFGTAQITTSTFSQNLGEGGGGIWNSGTLDVTNSTFFGNRAVRSGGGISNFGTMNVSNSTFANNSASEGGFGGGISSIHGTAHITNCTLTGNFADDGGGGIAGSFSVTSTIVAGNTKTNGSSDAFGDFTSGGFNLIGVTDGSTGFTAATDQRGTAASPFDPKLDPAGLQNNGGPTQTIALQPDSPAIDNGTSNSLTTDQRGPGFRRTVDYPSVMNIIFGDGTDIGAFEVQPGTGDFDGDGIPENRDPDTVAVVIMTLPDSDFNSPGNKNAFLRRLDEIELLILADDIDGAVEEWRNLRRHVDACGSSSADNNDWITNCDSQLHVRALSDTLSANLLN